MTDNIYRPDMEEMTPERFEEAYEIELVMEEFSTHPQLRLWPPPIHERDIVGDIILGFRGTDEEFTKFHNALIAAGYQIDESGEYEVYVYPLDEDGQYKEEYKKK